MPSSHIPLQDPSMSPTYSMSTNQPQAPPASSIRRNLFASHLSRRPVAPASQTLFAPSSPTQQNAQSQPDIYSGPTLQPTKRTMSFQDVYDPNVSPSNHPISPSTSSTMFPRESIIAVHPVTGKPLLPNLPTLPPRLRLSDEDDEEEDSDVEATQEQHVDYRHHGFARSPSFHNNLNLSSDLGFDPDMDSSELERMGMPSHQSHMGLNMVIDTNSEESHRDRERIERLLADMQARQRARARTINSNTSSEANTATTASSSSQAGRSRRLATGKTRERANADYHHPSSLSKINVATSAGLATGGVGATMDPHEKDELMGLIMTSLKRKLQTAEDEGWMYGGPDALGGIGGTGLESDAAGVYD